MPTCRHHRPGYRKVGRKRFPNKSIKVKERAYKQARELEDNLTEPPKIGIVLGLGVDKVSQLIRSVTGENEDAFQDAWVAIMEDHVATEDDIVNLTREVYHRHCAETVAKEHREVSLDEPIGEHRDEGEFTLKNILKSPEPRTDEEIDHDIDADTPYVANSSGKPNRKGSFYLDDDTKAELKRLYPHDTIHSAIRKVVGMPMAERDKRGWHKWEEAIIRQRFPWGGSRACQLDICRSRDAIYHKAHAMGLKVNKLNSYRPHPDWLNRVEVAQKLGYSREHVNWLAKHGFIRSIRLANYQQGGFAVFFTPQDVDNYLATRDSQNEKAVKIEVRRAYSNKYYKRKVERLEGEKISLQTKYEEQCAKLRKEAEPNRKMVRWLKWARNRISELKTELHQIKMLRHAEHRKLERHAKANIDKEVRLNEREIQLKAEEKQLRGQQKDLQRKERKYEARLKHFNRRSVNLSRKVKTVGQELRRERIELEDYANRLKKEREHVEGLFQEYKNSKESDIEIALSRLVKGECLVVEMGERIHYAVLNNDNEVAIACRPSRGVSVEFIKKYSYNPFVAKLPTCRVCQAMRRFKNADNSI